MFSLPLTLHKNGEFFFARDFLRFFFRSGIPFYFLQEKSIAAGIYINLIPPTDAVKFVEYI